MKLHAEEKKLAEVARKNINLPFLNKLPFAKNCPPFILEAKGKQLLQAGTKKD